MAELTVLEEKLAEVLGLAQAAKAATDKVSALTDEPDLSTALQRMHDEADETESRCTEVAGEIDGKKTAILDKARETKAEATEMMKTYLGEDADALDGFEFLTMAEAGEVGHWSVLRKLNERARRDDVQAARRVGAADPGAPLPGRARRLARARRPGRPQRALLRRTAMKVVVLGASGNAGTALLRALEAEPRVEEVVAVARRPPGDWASAEDDVALARRRRAIRSSRCSRGADAVVHLAWLIQPVARPRADPRRQRRRLAPRDEPRWRGGRPRARLRLVGRRVLARPQGPPRRRDVADRRGAHRRSTRATRPRSSGCSTRSSASIPTCASCACAPG